MRHLMAAVSALSLFTILCASADAAPAHRRPHVRARQPVIVPDGGQGAPRIAVPGWSDEATKRWLDNASSAWVHA